jgi:hypothetical protein
MLGRYESPSPRLITVSRSNFTLPVTAGASSGINFTPDGRGLAFRDTRCGCTRLYALPSTAKASRSLALPGHRMANNWPPSAAL